MTKANCKILLTTQSLEVSSQMMTNEDVREYFLNEEGDWNSFVQNARDIVK